MKEYEQKNVSEQFSSAGLERAIKNVWQESTMVNFSKLQNSTLKVLFTLCPLYQQGPLDQSKIMLPPASISQSRVSRKWDALQAVIGAIHSYLSSVGGKMEVSAVFANKGVLLGYASTKEDEEALIYHGTLYKEAVDSYFSQKGIDYSYLTYEDLDVNFPTFVNPSATIPSSEPSLNTQINEYLRDREISTTQVTSNKSGRRLIEKLHNLGGRMSTEAVFWLVTGYLAFDHMIPQIAGNNGLYLATERFEPLFSISNFTPALKEMPRINIKA